MFLRVFYKKKQKQKNQKNKHTKTGYKDMYNTIIREKRKELTFVKSGEKKI